MSKVTHELTDRQAIELADAVLDTVRTRCEPGHPSYADCVLIAHTILHGHPHPPVELSEDDRDQSDSIDMLRAAFPRGHLIWGFVSVDS